MQCLSKHSSAMSRPRFTLVLLLVVFSSPFARPQVVLAHHYRQPRKKEDYSFESQLLRATEECSYIARNDDESHKVDVIQRIKNEMNNRKVVEFYEEREEEKKRSKEYYDNVERQVRKKVLSEGSQGPPNRRRRPPPPPLPPPWRNDDRRRRKFHARRRPPRPPAQPSMPFPPGSMSPRRLPPPPRRSRENSLDPFPVPNDIVSYHLAVADEFEDGEIFKRSPRSKEPSFSEGTFKDHNNCFSRCVFARMELVDSLGFPQESQLRKTLEDLIDNRKLRSAKVRRVSKCFDDVKKVAIDDNCIYSTKIFKCMRLDEPGSWA